MIDLALRRQFYAEDVQIAANLKSPALVGALAAVPRERFLPPGPWTIRSENDFGGPMRQTADADPRHVYHNIAIGIDPARMLFNGSPSLISMAIDVLGVTPGDRVLHIGAGTGYFTALIAHCAGPNGRVVGIEADGDLASRAASNLASMPWVEVRHGDASAPPGESFDAILVNAGVTHAPDAWLDALAPDARMIAPITASMPAMGNIGKGPLVLFTRTADPGVLDVRVVTFVAIFSAVGIRDEALSVEIGQALMKNPMPPLKRLRRSAHERGETCWIHRDGFCLSTSA